MPAGCAAIVVSARGSRRAVCGQPMISDRLGLVHLYVVATTKICRVLCNPERRETCSSAAPIVSVGLDRASYPPGLFVQPRLRA